MNHVNGKIIIEHYQREAFEDCTLQVIHESPTLKAYRLTPKRRFHWCTIVDTGFCLFVGGDQGFQNGSILGGAAVSAKMTDATTWFADLSEDDLEYMGSKFFGEKPGSREYERGEKWASDVAWMHCLQQEFSRLYRAHLAKQEKKSKKKRK